MEMPNLWLPCEVEVPAVGLIGSQDGRKGSPRKASSIHNVGGEFNLRGISVNSCPLNVSTFKRTWAKNDPKIRDFSTANNHRLMTDQHHGHLSSATVETTAGLTAGLVSTAIVHPLDIIKTRLQVDSRRSGNVLGSSLRTFTSIFRTEGGLPSLYRGLTPNLIGNSASWALYFLWYGQAQDLIRRYRAYDSGTQLNSLDYLTASVVSGTLTAVLTNPIWVVKTRMLSTSARQRGAYPSMLRGLTSIYHTEGLRGYFAGLTPALFGVSHGALYFVVYERLKRWRRGASVDGKLSNLDTILTSSLAKVWAGTLTYPHQLVRTRMQTAKGPGLGLWGTVRNVWVEEGVMAFYKGLGPNLLRVVPSTCVTFLVYENVKYGLPRVWDGGEKEAV